MPVATVKEYEDKGTDPEVELGGAHAMARVGDTFYHFGGYSVKSAQRHSGFEMFYLPINVPSGWSFVIEIISLT